MTAPLDPPADPIGERASELLDAGVAPAAPGLDAAVARRLAELLEARQQLRDVPAPDVASRERAIAAALATFDLDVDAPASGSTPSSVAGIDTATGTGRTRTRVSSPPRRPARWLAPLAAVAAGAVVVIGVVRLGSSSDSKKSTSAAGGAASASTAISPTDLAQDAGLADQSAAKAAAPAGAAATTAAATSAGGGASTAAAAAVPPPTSAAAATTTAGTAAIPTAASGNDLDRSLPDLGVVNDAATLRTKLDALSASYEAGTATSAPAPLDACTTSDRRPVARVTWQGAPAVVFSTNDGHYVVLSPACTPLAQL